jgi:hypothetical protein
MTIVVMMAADVVFNLPQFAFSIVPVAYTRPVLDWGASSSVDFSAVQFLHGSGCQNILVIATNY